MTLSTPLEKANHLINCLQKHGQGDQPPPLTVQPDFPEGASNRLILAALLHDIGQIIPLDSTREIHLRMNLKADQSVGRIGHETLGAEYLRGLGFSETVCRLVESCPCEAVRRQSPAITIVIANLVAVMVELTIADISRLWEARTTIRCLLRRKSGLSSQGGPFSGAELATFEADPLREEMVLLRL